MALGLWDVIRVGVATRGDLACYLASVAIALGVASDEDPIIFYGKKSGDFDNWGLGPLGSVSREVESKRSFTGLTARAFFLVPFGTEGEKGVMASVVTQETTRGSTRGEGGEGSLLARFEAEVVSFGSSEDLFLVELLLRVFTIVSRSRHNTMK